jgi:hypothetical protein
VRYEIIVFIGMIAQPRLFPFFFLRVRVEGSGLNLNGLDYGLIFLISLLFVFHHLQNVTSRSCELGNVLVRTPRRFSSFSFFLLGFV